ncbi:MAG: DUF4397 domain-containing protein [Caldimonas sp.]
MHGSPRFAPIAALSINNASSSPRLTGVLETQGSQVRNFRIRAGWLVAFAAVALSACGGGGSNNQASVRLVNATLTHASLNLLANSTAVVSATATDTVSAYVGVDAGSPSLQVNDATSGSVLATTAPTLAKDSHSALVAYESGGSVRTAMIAEDTTVPSAGTAVLRVFDAATDAGSIDVYVTDPATDITTLSAPTFSFPSSTGVQSSNFLAFGPGTYRIRVTGSGNPADLRLDIASVVLASQQVATVILTPTSGGTLANGSVLTQQGTYTATRNSSARVRLAAAVSGNAVVTAGAGAASIGTGVIAPAIGAYTNVPAGSAISVSVNGTAIAAPAATLAAGSDATLLVYGNAGSATATLITDDNHLPVSTSNFKLRMINGVTGAATPLSLDVNFAVVASNVTPGSASTYAVVTAGTATHLDVTSPASLTPIYTTNPDLSIPGNAVFTLFMLGDASAPIHLLRRDR